VGLRLERATVAVAALLVRAACGSDDTSSSSSVTSAATAPSSVAATATPPATTDAGSDQTTGVCDTPSLHEQFPPAAKARTAFVRGANVPQFVEQLFAYADDATAQQVLSTFDTNAQSCTSFDQNGYHFTIGQLSFPSMGDQTTSYRLTGTQAASP
jgi:hypothetical protein